MNGVSYFWYHFGLSGGTIEAIEDAIYSHNYKAFKEFQDMYPDNLPSRLLVVEDGNYTSIDLDEDSFQTITYSEHENG